MIIVNRATKPLLHGETFVIKYMVNVNALLTTKRAFILWYYQRNVHQTNGGFVDVGLNADFSHKVFEQ